jgi:hypothetical protein
MQHTDSQLTAPNGAPFERLTDTFAPLFGPFWAGVASGPRALQIGFGGAIVHGRPLLIVDSHLMIPGLDFVTSNSSSSSRASFAHQEAAWRRTPDMGACCAANVTGRPNAVAPLSSGSKPFAHHFGIM